MSLPFSPDAFLDVFARYNVALWPVALVEWLLAAVVLTAVWGRAPSVTRSKAAALLLAALWGWSGLAYHARYFSAINPAAPAFAALFVVQAALLVGYGLAGSLALGTSRPSIRAVGLAIAAYALAYPLLTLAFGHQYPRTPTFGVPCPTTIYTIGLLLTCRSLPWTVVLIPLSWCAVGGSAAVWLGMTADYGLVVSGALLIGARWSRDTLAPAHR